MAVLIISNRIGLGGIAGNNPTIQLILETKQNQFQYAHCG